LWFGYMTMPQLYGVRAKNNLLWYITQKTAIDYESYLGSGSFTD